MDIFADTVADFGKRLGMPNLRPGPNGGIDLMIERVGRLQLERDGDHVVILLARAWPKHAERVAEAALNLCHWRENHPWPINPGVKGEEWLLFAARLPLAQFDVPELDKVVGYLSNLLDEAEKLGT